MNFFTHLISVFIGSSLGFIFAIFLFYITENYKKKREKKSILKCLHREFQNNIILIDKWIAKVNEIIFVISNDAKLLQMYINFSLFQSYFLKESSKKGILYDFIDNKDIIRLNEMLALINQEEEKYINKVISSWNFDKLIKKGALDIFNDYKKILSAYKIDLENIMGKIFKNKKPASLVSHVSR
jgi:hypothetical protein